MREKVKHDWNHIFYHSSANTIKPRKRVNGVRVWVSILVHKLRTARVESVWITTFDWVAVLRCELHFSDSFIHSFLTSVVVMIKKNNMCKLTWFVVCFHAAWLDTKATMECSEWLHSMTKYGQAVFMLYGVYFLSLATYKVSKFCFWYFLVHI